MNRCASRSSLIWKPGWRLAYDRANKLFTDAIIIYDVHPHGYLLDEMVDRRLPYSTGLFPAIRVE